MIGVVDPLARYRDVDLPNGLAVRRHCRVAELSVPLPAHLVAYRRGRRDGSGSAPLWPPSRPPRREPCSSACRPLHRQGSSTCLPANDRRRCPSSSSSGSGRSGHRELWRSRPIGRRTAARRLCPWSRTGSPTSTDDAVGRGLVLDEQLAELGAGLRVHVLELTGRAVEHLFEILVDLVGVDAREYLCRGDGGRPVPLAGTGQLPLLPHLPT